MKKAHTTLSLQRKITPKEGSENQAFLTMRDPYERGLAWKIRRAQKGKRRLKKGRHSPFSLLGEILISLQIEEKTFRRRDVLRRGNEKENVAKWSVGTVVSDGVEIRLETP